MVRSAGEDTVCVTGVGDGDVTTIEVVDGMGASSDGQSSGGCFSIGGGIIPGEDDPAGG